MAVDHRVEGREETTSSQEVKNEEIRQCTGCSKSIYDTERFCGACHNN